jgi:hypothetical protein
MPGRSRPGMLLPGVRYSVTESCAPEVNRAFQIVRMRTDLLKAPPDVGTETIEIRFNEVRLPVVAKSFWLPNDAVVTRSAKDGAIREKHQFSDYKIFVQTKPAPAPNPDTQKAQ